MRKFLIFIVIILFILGISATGWVAYRSFFVKSELTVEDITPAEPVIFLKISDVKKNFDKIFNNKIYNTIQNLNYPRLMQTTSLSWQQLFLINILKGEFIDPKLTIYLKEFFSEELALAFYSPSDEKYANLKIYDLFIKSMTEEMLSKLILVTRVPYGVNLEDLIPSLVSKMPYGMVTETVPYKEKIIKTIIFNEENFKISFVQFEDFIVISLGENLIKQSIDAYLDRNNSLAKSNDFKKVSERFSDKKDINVFIDLKQFTDVFKEHSFNMTTVSKIESENQSKSRAQADLGLQEIEKIESKVNNVLKRMSGFKFIGISVKNENITSLTASIFFEKDRIDNSYKEIFTCSSEENESIYFVPEKILGYQWDNCFDLKKIWQENKNSQFKDFSVLLEQFTGLDIEKDIIPVFGNQIGGFLSNLYLEEKFIIPDLVFFIEIRDKTKLDNLLNKLEERIQFKLNKENYSNTPLTYLQLPIFNKIQPGYCVLKNYFVLGINPSAIKSSIDASNDKLLSILDNNDFKDVNVGLTGKNCSVKFIKFDEFSKLMVTVFGWFDKWSAQKEKMKDVFRSGTEQNLKDIRSKLVVQQRELERIILSLRNKKNELEDLKDKGEDTFPKEKEIEIIEKIRDQKHKQVEDLLNQRQEVSNLLDENYSKTKIGKQLRQIYLNEIGYPFVRSFTTISGVGIKTSSYNDFFETTFFIKMND